MCLIDADREGGCYVGAPGEPPLPVVGVKTVVYAGAEWTGGPPIPSVRVEEKCGLIHTVKQVSNIRFIHKHERVEVR